MLSENSTEKKKGSDGQDKDRAQQRQREERSSYLSAGSLHLDTFTVHFIFYALWLKIKPFKEQRGDRGKKITSNSSKY